MKEVKYTPWELFKNSAEKYRNSIAVIHNDVELTYEQLNKKIEQFDILIRGLNFKIGGIYLPNRIEFISCMFSLNKLNKVVVPLSYQYKGEVLQELINFSDTELVITDSKGYLELKNLRYSSNIKWILVLQDSGEFMSYELESENREIQGLEDNVFCVCFTSGSTSKPKGIMLSNFAVTGNAFAVAEYLGFNCDDRTIIMRSLAQASPITGDILMAISKGGSIILLNDLFHPAIFLKAIQEHKGTNTFMIRTMLSQVLEYPHLNNYDLSSMKRIMLGGMSNPRKIFIEAMEKLPKIDFYNAYGLSEASARVSFLGHDDMRNYPGSIGKAMRGCNIKVYREDGNEAEIDEIGEIYVNSDYVMNGYYKADELTGQTLTQKGLRSRDTGYKDKNGLFYVVGRNDDLIIQGGNKVYPVEIEQILLMHSGIREAEVFGLEDEKLGQKIIALVSCKQDFHVDAQELYKWCRANLEDKKIPKNIQVVDKIPRNPIGKISKNDLKKYYKNLIQEKEIN